jgi:hypothetical protein
MSGKTAAIEIVSALHEESVDEVLDDIILSYRATSRIDGASERVRKALHSRLRWREIDDAQIRLFEVNVLENLSSWIEFVIEENGKGRNRIPDFARNLQHVFIAHCRQHQLDPTVALSMAVELATAIIDTALSFKRLLRIEAERGEVTGRERTVSPGDGVGEC